MSYMKQIVIVLLMFILYAGVVSALETVQVGYHYNPPEIFITSDGHVSGLFPEVLSDIAEKNNWKILYVKGTWQECVNNLESCDIDLMVDVPFSDEYQQYFDFSKEPVLVNWGRVFTRSDRPVQSFTEFEGRTVAVVKDSIHTDGSNGIKALMSGLSVRCSYVEVDTCEDVMMLLDSRQADIGIVDYLSGYLYYDRYDVQSAPVVFNPSKIMFGTIKGSQRGNALIEVIDKNLHDAKQDPDSVYQRAMAYYLGGGTQEKMGKAARDIEPLSFSEEELKWISDHPVIRFSIDPGFTPFEFISSKNEFEGLSADFMDLITRKTGIRFELILYKTWSESIQAVKDKKIDLLPCIGDAKARRSFLSFSEPYLEFARVIVTALDSDMKALDDFTDMKVAVQADSSHHSFLTEQTRIKPVLYETYRECLLAVSRGEVDAAVGNLAVTTQLMRELSLTNIMMAGYASPEPQSLSMGVRRDWPELTGILNKTLQSMSMRERNNIFAKWLPLPKAANNGIDLSREEREWLLMHPKIKVAWDQAWAPIEFADSDGKPAGISMEYLNAIENILGIEFEKSKSSSWEESHNKLKNHELDMSACLAVTPERLEKLVFTEDYLDSPVVFFSLGYAPYIRGFDELEGRRVAVVKGYATDGWITRDYPDLNILKTSTIAEGFNLLKEGEIDVFVCNVIPGTYYLSEHQYNDIKIAGETPYSYKLRMAVRNDWPVFKGILQKAIDSIPDVDKNSFYRKWITISYERKIDYALIIKIVLAALAVILIFFYWNRRLSSEVGRRKQAQKALSESESALRKSYAELRKLEEMKENLTNMIVHDMRSPLMSITGSIELALFDIDLDADRDEIKGNLALARESAKKVIGMAQALLDTGRLEEGRMPLNRSFMNINDAIAEAIRAMEIQAQLADVKLGQSGDQISCNADSGIIHRVLVNLIGNAVKASPAGETVLVCTEDKGDLLTIEVRDNGRGIAKKYQDTLFDKFSGIEHGRTGGDSVGLGLTFCKLAVEAHGGSIEIESEEGRGSIFRISLMKV